MAEEALAAKARGNAHFQAQRWDEAIAEYSKAIELDPSQHAFFSNRSACYAGLQKFEEALADATKCVELKSDWPKGYSRKGCALFGLQRFDEAKAAYEEGLKLDPNNAALQEGLRDVENALAQANNPFASMFGESLWGKIATNPRTSQFLSDPQFVNKVKMLQANPQQMLPLFMKDPQMMEVINVVFESMGINLSGGPPPPGADDAQPGASNGAPTEDSAPMEDDESEEEEPPKPKELTEEEKHKEEAEQAKDKGNALYKAKKFDEAIAEYSRAAELVPDSPVYLSNRSAVYFMKGEYEKAAEDCLKTLELARKSYDSKFAAKAYTRLGDIAVRQNELDTAIEHFNKSLIEETNYKVKKKLKAAEAAKDKAEKEAYLDPEKALVHKEAGNKAFQEAKWQVAIDEYSESIKRNPNDHKVYSNRAGAYSKLMAWEYALKDCNKCIELEPSFAKAYLRKGKIEHFCKEYQKALATFNKGLEYEPGSQQLLEAKMATVMAVRSSAGDDPERRARALADPEVQKIIQDANFTKTLQDIQSNPAAAARAMADPEVRKKLEVLEAAGFLQMK